MRLWLLLRRRRRLLTLAVTSGLTFFLLSSFGFLGLSHHQSPYETFDNSDYDLNYDSVDAVHAMVRQMSSIKRRNQLQFDEDTQEHREPEPMEEANKDPDSDTALRFEPAGANKNKLQTSKKRKIRLGIGDYPDIPDNVPKKYSFIHEQHKSTTPQPRTSGLEPETKLRGPSRDDMGDNAQQGNEHDDLQDDARNPEGKERLMIMHRQSCRAVHERGEHNCDMVS